jgi:hypothetical protein
MLGLPLRVFQRMQDSSPAARLSWRCLTDMAVLPGMAPAEKQSGTCIARAVICWDAALRASTASYDNRGIGQATVHVFIGLQALGRNTGMRIWAGNALLPGACVWIGKVLPTHATVKSSAMLYMQQKQGARHDRLHSRTMSLLLKARQEPAQLLQCLAVCSYTVIGRWQAHLRRHA